ncbi:hypothetical protein CRE_04598 [Caenorhabditis remanei]|uniref:Uncharacterized protein n=1 Tax=Caenorhabditis remanei TaxID=31234 RepID=E3LZC0_CAERE|nr:hypothetical protein CRE_04598 [Caenorhabditis remanei]
MVASTVWDEKVSEFKVSLLFIRGTLLSQSKSSNTQWSQFAQLPLNDWFLAFNGYAAHARSRVILPSVVKHTAGFSWRTVQGSASTQDSGSVTLFLIPIISPGWHQDGNPSNQNIC